MLIFGFIAGTIVTFITIGIILGGEPVLTDYAIKADLIILVCTECGGVFAIESGKIEDADSIECYYCGSDATGTVVTGEVM